MIGDNEELVIIFNGEIYNYIELRRELENLGHVFKTKSDTEVILKGYQQWGYECQNKFNGMWSFALWDDRKKILFLSRDRIGEKPLFYSIQNGYIVFASEIKSLFKFGVPKIPNTEVLELYLTFSYIPEPFTFFKNIEKLKAGHFLTIDYENSIKIGKYWDLPQINTQNLNNNKNEVYKNFKYLLEDSVKIRMRSDVPFGAFLSGGLDSSTIVSIMSAISNYPVETFTIGYKEKEFDESDLAELVAQKYGCNFNVGTVNQQSFFDLIDHVVFHYDEPFGDSSAISVGQVSKFASKKVKMVITGDGGDEVLSGYTVYQGIKFSEIYKNMPNFAHSLISYLLNYVLKIFSGNNRYRLNRINNIISSSRLDYLDMLIEKLCWIPYKTILEICNEDKNTISIRDFLSDFFGQYLNLPDFYKQMYFNLKISLPNDMLVKVDRMSMAYSLETRVPFLDYRLVEYMTSVNKKIKMHGFERKTILKEIYKNSLPEKLLKARKHGFNVPLREWFKDSQVTNYFENMIGSDNILNRNKLKEVLNLNKNGYADFGNFLWMVTILNKSILDSV